MPRPKKARAEDRKYRRNVAVDLTDEELKQLKHMAIDIGSTSMAIATEAIRKELRKHYGTQK